MLRVMTATPASLAPPAPGGADDHTDDDHAHVWSEIATELEGEYGVHTWSACVCSSVRHVFTHATLELRFENVFAGDTWAAGYACGLAQGRA